VIAGFSFCLGVMSGKQEHRIFVGGLGWDVTERELEEAFECYGKILECQVPFSLPSLYFLLIEILSSFAAIALLF